ncbi:MAG TPA: MBL fold metallo-hydrolase [Spirochaetota bacterium]|nr:MBL fold metallo-hydrolase [Spirochaetota bacterium]HPI89323.1 MBL fold metallo-hydrolase [Spirochaetota bacterium]HPR49240.1 MBL fold metallo-hydrolase [Spirochaetota bacterium]
MKQYANGKINEYLSVAGNAIYPAYLVRGTEKSMQIDAGINLFGPLYVKSLDELLGDHVRLDYLFITHSHYDHLGASPYLKKKIPGLKIGGHARVAALMKKESVLRQMTGLSEIQRGLFAQVVGDEDVSLEPIDLDYELKEGDSFDLGGLECLVYEVPGHTRDSLAFYFPETGMLFPGESIGYVEDSPEGGVQVEFLSSFDDYVASLEKMIALRPALIGMGHGWIYTGDDAACFLDRSHAATFKYRELLERYLDSVDGDVDRAIEKIASIEYDQKGTIRQERNAYVMNLTAQVKHIAGLCRERSRPFPT